MRFGVGIGDEDVPHRPNYAAAGKFRLRLCRRAALGQRFRVGIDISLGQRRRAQRHEVQPVLAAPSGADFARRGIPERRMRLLQRPHRDRHLLIEIVLAFVTEQISRQAGADAFERVDKNVARLVVLDFVEFELIGRNAAPDADIEPTVA